MTPMQLFVHRLNRILAGMFDAQIEFISADKLARTTWELDELENFLSLGLPLPSYIEPTSAPGSVFGVPLVVEKKLVGLFILSHLRGADSVRLFHISDLVDWLFTSTVSQAAQLELIKHSASDVGVGPFQSSQSAASSSEKPDASENSNVVMFRPRTGSIDLASIFGKIPNSGGSTPSAVSPAASADSLSSSNPKFEDMDTRWLIGDTNADLEANTDMEGDSDPLSEFFSGGSLEDKLLREESILHRPLLIEVNDMTLDARLMALCLHEMSMRWAFISSKDMPKGLFDSASSLQDLGSMTLMVPFDEILQENQMHSLENYAEQFQEGTHPQVLIFAPPEKQRAYADRLTGFHRIKCSLGKEATLKEMRAWWKGLDETIREINSSSVMLPLAAQSANLFTWKHNTDPSSNPN